MKHNKFNSIKEANLENVILALSSLYVLNRYILKHYHSKNGGIDIFVGDSKFIEIDDFDSITNEIAFVVFDEENKTLSMNGKFL